MKVGHRLAELLAEYGVEYVFGVPGGQTLSLYEGIMRLNGNIRHVLMRDERSAGFAADAYARVTGKTGVCDATVGPGATNLVSPMAEAYNASIPLLAIISDIPRAWEHRRTRGNASQAMKQLEIFSTISKWQVTLNEPFALDDVVDAAFRVATTGKPGPVVISIPEDVFWAAAAEPKSADRSQGALFPRHRTAPDPEAVKRARDAILKSRKPVLLVGGGALISDAGEEVRALAEHLGSPVCTTITGKGIMEETHPLVFGVCGSMANPVANQVIGEADMVMFVGTKAGQLATFGYDMPKPWVPTIHVDMDPEEIGRNFPDSLPLVSDVRLAIRDLLRRLGKDRPQTDWHKEPLAQMREDWYKSAVDKKTKEGDPMKPQAIMDVVNRVVTEEDMIVCDASLASGWAAAYCRMPKPGRRFLAPRGLAGLGWGAPAAIGAALATGKNQRVLLFAGDGGFAYSVQELAVMARLELPVVTILFNNDTLAWIKHVEKNRFKEGFISTDFRHIDFAMVARGFGARAYTAETLDGLQSALEKEEAPNGPAVIDMFTDQWETPVLRFSSSGGGKGRRA
jgi:acetolactate synthase-1/2/3 large subunit